MITLSNLSAGWVLKSTEVTNTFKMMDKPLGVYAATSILTPLYVDTAPLPLYGMIAEIEPEQIHLAIKQSRMLEQTAKACSIMATR